MAGHPASKSTMTYRLDEWTVCFIFTKLLSLSPYPTDLYVYPLVRVMWASFVGSEKVSFV
jgi:hypothetical protein